MQNADPVDQEPRRKLRPNQRSSNDSSRIKVRWIKCSISRFFLRGNEINFCFPSFFLYVNELGALTTERTVWQPLNLFDAGKVNGKFFFGWGKTGEELGIGSESFTYFMYNIYRVERLSIVQYIYLLILILHFDCMIIYVPPIHLHIVNYDLYNCIRFLLYITGGPFINILFQHYRKTCTN